MQQGQKLSKKWVDYSDSSEEQQDSDHEIPLRHTQSQPVTTTSKSTTVDHRSQDYIDQQLKRLQSAKQNFRDLWVLLECDDQSLLDKKVRDFKDIENPDILNIYMNKEIKGSWDFKVKSSLVEVWIKDGIDHDKKIKVSVSDRNFRARERGGDRPRERGQRGGRRGRGDRGERGQRGQRGDRRGRPRRDRGEGANGTNQPEKKRVYVDKATGKAPSNKVEVQQQLIQEKQRHYTKTQAERVGLELGNFRNKQKGDFTPKIVQQKVEQPVKKVKEDVKMWARKQKGDQRKEENGQKQQKKQQAVKEYKEKPKVGYRQKQSQQEKKTEQPILEAGKNKRKQSSELREEKKKKYVRVDNITQEQKQNLKLKNPIPVKNDKQLLSEDSN